MNRYASQCDEICFWVFYKTSFSIRGSLTSSSLNIYIAVTYETTYVLFHINK